MSTNLCDLLDWTEATQAGSQHPSLPLPKKSDSPSESASALPSDPFLASHGEKRFQ